MPAQRSLEELEAGLTAMVITRENSRKAEALLAEQGLKIGASTLRNWVKENPARFHELQRGKAGELANLWAGKLEQSVEAAHEATLAAIKKARSQISGLKGAEAANFAFNLARTMDTLNKTLSLAQGKPTEIVSTQSGDEQIRKAMAELVASDPEIAAVFDSTAQDVTPELTSGDELTRNE